MIPNSQLILILYQTLILFDHILHNFISCHVHPIIHVASLNITTFEGTYICKQNLSKIQNKNKNKIKSSNNNWDKPSTMDGILFEHMGRQDTKNGNWTDEQLYATLLAVDDGAPIKTVARIHGISTTSLQNHDT